VTGRRQPPQWRWLALLLLVFVLAAADAAAQTQLQVSIARQGLDDEALRASRQLVDDVLARLPAQMRGGGAMQLQLHWRDDLPVHVQGRARGRTLALDRSLLAPLFDRDNSVAWQRARAALIHEIAHALDRSAQGGWSAQPRFRDLAGWQQRPLLPGRGRNRNHLRSPDRYELHSPAEFFAVNLEHYLLDADYRCRRPALHDWLQSQLGQGEGAAHDDCDPSLPFMQAGEREGDSTLVGLDPARVYQVDYLLAEGNDRIMSRWGHSMLRLVVCAPGRAPGPACRMDLQYHLVLSFRAFVGDVQISSLRGLSGSYPSRLFVLPLNQVVDEYTKVELRPLSSVPLGLQRAEIEALLQQAAQLHWSYDGRYFFISNNCAVETWKLLHDGVPRLAGQPLASITPTGLARRLRRQQLLEPIPEQGADAVRLGYYFESAASHHALVFDGVRQTLGLPAGDVEQWLGLPAAQRRPWMQQAGGKQLAALLLLEQAAWRRQELLARDVLKRRLLAGNGAAAELAQFNALMERAGALVAPGSLPLAGYGLPSAAERLALQSQIAQGEGVAAEQWQALRRAALALLSSAQRQELDGVVSNLDLLRQQLRMRYGAEQEEVARP